MIINDRGVPITNLDKTKSLILFNVDRYFDEESEKDELIGLINKKFGEVFASIDKIRGYAENYDINYIRDLDEDRYLQLFYHYFAKYSIDQYDIETESYQFRKSADNVFDEHIKRSLETVKENKRLGEFIEDFLDYFSNWLSSFSNLVGTATSPDMESEQDVQIMKLLRFVKLDRYSFPILLNLAAIDSIDLDFLKLIEAVDLRMYKIRPGDPIADMYRNVIANMIWAEGNKDELKTLYNRVAKYLSWWGYDDIILAEFRNHNVYNKVWLPYVLWEYMTCDKKDLNLKIDIYDAKENRDKLQKEHIFPTSTSNLGGIKKYGFKSGLDYENHINNLGNLVLLDKNPQASDKPPKAKGEIYIESELSVIREFGAVLEENGFDKEKLLKRTEEIAKFCTERWIIPEIEEE